MNNPLAMVDDMRNASSGMFNDCDDNVIMQIITSVAEVGGASSVFALAQTCRRMKDVSNEVFRDSFERRPVKSAFPLSLRYRHSRLFPILLRQSKFNMDVTRSMIGNTFTFVSSGRWRKLLRRYGWRIACQLISHHDNVDLSTSMAWSEFVEAVGANERAIRALLQHIRTSRCSTHRISRNMVRVHTLAGMLATHDDALSSTCGSIGLDLPLLDVWVALTLPSIMAGSVRGCEKSLQLVAERHNIGHLLATAEFDVNPLANSCSSSPPEFALRRMVRFIDAGAVKYGHPQLFDVTFRVGRTHPSVALIHAASFGQVDVCRTLFDESSKMNRCACDIEMMLFVANQQNHAEVVELARSLGAKGSYLLPSVMYDMANMSMNAVLSSDETILRLLPGDE